ncbi:hypothetical protein SUDANB121_03212 [Nocardiopsis dassonvillei]
MELRPDIVVAGYDKVAMVGSPEPEYVHTTLLEATRSLRGPGTSGNNAVARWGRALLASQE